MVELHKNSITNSFLYQKSRSNTIIVKSYFARNHDLNFQIYNMLRRCDNWNSH